MEMKTYKIGDLYTVSNGLSKGKAFFGQGHPFLTFSEVMNNFFIPETLQSLVQTDDKERVRFSIKRGDIFLNRTSETADELGISCVALKDYPNATFNGFCKRLRPISEDVVPEYIGYYLRITAFRKHMSALSGNMITRASLRNEQLLSIEIELPSKEVQLKIANILRQYDLMIDNCTQQIALLEEAAQRIYNHTIFETELNSTKLSDFIKFRSGYAFKSSSFIHSGKFRLVTIKNVKDGVFDETKFNYLTEIPPKLPSHCILNNGDLVMSLTGDVARCCHIVGENCLLNQRVAKIETPYPNFAYLFLRSHNVHMILCNMANGAAQQNLSPRRAENEKFEAPPKSQIEKIETALKPYLDKLQTQREIIHNLKRCRDLLLPRLISGQIKIKA